VLLISTITPLPWALIEFHGGYLKAIVKDDKFLENFVNIANMFIELGHWLTHFKISSSIIIPKLNKAFYNSSKSFHPIVLLNMLGKLIKKVIGECLQFHMIANNFVHPYQLGGLKQCLMIDMGIFITYLICLSWVKNLWTNTLAFDIIQFFPSLNH